MWMRDDGCETMDATDATDMTDATDATYARTLSLGISGTLAIGVASGVGSAGKAIDRGGVGPQASVVGTTVVVAKSSKTKVSVGAISPSLSLSGTLAIASVAKASSVGGGGVAIDGSTSKSGTVAIASTVAEASTIAVSAIGLRGGGGGAESKL